MVVQKKQSTAKLIYNGSVPYDSSHSTECNYNIVIYTINNEYLRARNYEQDLPNAKIDLFSLQGARIPMEHIRPRFLERFTIAPQPLPTNAFVKTPQLATYVGTSKFTPARILLSEARILEYLTRFPHPNIAKYHGCVLEGNRISGLCMTRYTMTLLERVRLSLKGTLSRPAPCEVEDWCNDIKRGLHHLHRHGYVHEDLDPRNVMLDSDNRAVIIDFDSCQVEGEPLGPKSYGCPPWINQQKARGEISDRDHDFEGLRVIQEFLEKYQKSEEPSTSGGEGPEDERRSEASESDGNHVLGAKPARKRKCCDTKTLKKGTHVIELDSHRTKRQRIMHA